MSEWRGLHRRKKHYNEPQWDVLPGEVYCWNCEAWCSQKHTCRCCLEAEVERLTAALADRDQKIEEALALCERSHADGFVATWKIERALRGES